MGGGEEKVNMSEALDASLQRLSNLVASLPERLQLHQKMECGKKFATEHPMVTLFLVVSVALGSVPLICFFAFACGSLLLTFTGFVFVEGFLLTVGGVMLGGVMCVMGFLSLGLSLLFALSWMAFTSANRLLSQARERIQQAKTGKPEPSSSHPSRPKDVENLKDSSQEKAE